MQSSGSGVRILFMGTPDFAVPSLRALAHNGLCPVAVATGPDRPRGRGRRITPTAVKVAALDLGIRNILQPPRVKAPAFAHEVQALQPDIIAVVAYKILPRAVYTAARLGAFNLHASLLPRYRGAAPIQRALMAGETKTGVTTFFLQDAVDTGQMILQWPTAIRPEEDAGMLHDRLKLLGARAVLATARRIAAERAHPVAQDDTLASPAPKLFPRDCQVPWHKSAVAVHNHCRGLAPYPGAWTRHHGRLLKLLAVRPADGSGPPGTVLQTAPLLRVACGTDAVEVLRIQKEGHRRMECAAFLNGYTISPGELFC